MQGWVAQDLAESDLVLDIYSKWSILASIMLVITLDMGVGVLMQIPLEAPIRNREMASNFYSPIAYIVAKILVDVPFVLAAYSAGFSVAYTLIGFTGVLWKCFAVVILHCLVSMSLCWFIS